jgi:hypothetical protein
MNFHISFVATPIILSALGQTRFIATAMKRVVNQSISSTATAVASPPPMHKLAIPRLPPFWRKA